MCLVKEGYVQWQIGMAVLSVVGGGSEATTSPPHSLHHMSQHASNLKPLLSPELICMILLSVFTCTLLHVHTVTRSVKHHSLDCHKQDLRPLRRRTATTTGPATTSHIMYVLQRRMHHAYDETIGHVGRPQWRKEDK